MPKSSPKTFELSDGITLRGTKTADADKMYKIYDANRDYLSKTLDWVANYTLEKARRDFAPADKKIQSGEWLSYWVAQADAVIGGVGGTIDSEQTLDLGYWLIESATGKGFATQATQKVVDYAFQEHGVTLVELEIKPENYASQRLAERLGAVNTGEQAQRTTDDVTSIFDIWEIKHA